MPERWLGHFIKMNFRTQKIVRGVVLIIFNLLNQMSPFFLDVKLDQISRK